MVGIWECHGRAKGGEAVRWESESEESGRIEPGRGAGDPLETEVDRGRPRDGGRVAGGVQRGVVDFA